MIFRFPVPAIDEEAMQAYCIQDRITLTQTGEFHVLEIDLSEEEGGDWVEAEGRLRRLVPLREQIIQGDYRMLYLAWLKATTLDQQDDAEDKSEPPVPAGLRNLTGGLQSFIELFEIDPHLVQTAAESSAALQPVPDQALASALARLPRQECDAFLLRVLQNEAQVGSALRKRLIELSGLEKPAASHRSRSVATLSKGAKRYEQEEQRREQAEAEQKRIQELEELAKHEDTTWSRVENLIEQKQAKPYEEAVALLVKLRDLAAYQDKLPEFESRIAALAIRYARRSSLMERLHEVGLVRE